MNGATPEEYHRRRERECRAMADGASSPAISRIHRVLAADHASRLQQAAQQPEGFHHP